MDYIFLGLGIVVILISLYLSYRAEKKEDENNYLEAEILSEIRGLKTSLQRLSTDQKPGNFKELVNEEYKIGNLNKNIQQLQQQITNLEAEISRLSNLEKSKDSNMINQQAVEKIESKAYKKIKSFKEDGLSMSEIAKKMDLGMREVELIWKLHSRREL